jgi:predicted RNA polymerase sigma factor
MVTLNRIVAVAMVDGPHAGLQQLAAAEADPALAGNHRVDAARAYYRLAATRTLNIPEQRYLESRAASRQSA